MQKDSEKKKEQTKDKTISTKDQKTWGKAYVNAMNEWEKQIKQWEKKDKLHMPESMKNRAEAALIHITSDKVPQLIYYYGSSVVVFQYHNGSVPYSGHVHWNDGDNIEFYYAKNAGKGYFVRSSASREERTIYKVKTGFTRIFHGEKVFENYIVDQFGEEKKLDRLDSAQYYSKFFQMAGNLNYQKVDEKDIISAKAMKKKLGGK